MNSRLFGFLKRKKKNWMNCPHENIQELHIVNKQFYEQVCHAFECEQSLLCHASQTQLPRMEMIFT